MALDTEMKQKIEVLRRQYPKRAESIVSDVAGSQLEKGGAIPTSALHFLSDKS
jgi:hypothetical protein